MLFAPPLPTRAPHGYDDAAPKQSDLDATSGTRPDRHKHQNYPDDLQRSIDDFGIRHANRDYVTASEIIPALEWQSVRKLWRWRPIRPVLVVIGIVAIAIAAGATNPAHPRTPSPPTTSRPCTYAAQAGASVTHRANDSEAEFREQQLEDYVGAGCKINP